LHTCHFSLQSSVSDKHASKVAKPACFKHIENIRVQHYYIFQTILHDFKYELVCIGEGGRLGIAVALPLPSYMLISAQSRRFFPATMVVRQSTCVQFASFSPKLVECYAIFDGLRRQTQRSQPVAKLWQLWHNLNITEAMLDWLYRFGAFNLFLMSKPDAVYTFFSILNFSCSWVIIDKVSSSFVARLRQLQFWLQLPRSCNARWVAKLLSHPTPE